VATDPHARPEHVVTPGHVFPLKARTGGVLVRTGQTEGAVDLARLAGLRAAGVICEIMKDDGTMARMPDLEGFAQQHGLIILTIADLIQYRLQTETLVERVAERRIRLDQTGTEWLAIVYRALAEPRHALALVKGVIEPGEPVLCRVHSGSVVGDLFCSPAFEGGVNLREAISHIESEGRGVLLYLDSQRSLAEEFDALSRPSSAGFTEGVPLDAPGVLGDAPNSTRSATSMKGPQQTLRRFGLGAQMLADLGARKLRLLTNSQRKIAGLTGYGLEIVERVPLVGHGDSDG